MKRNVLMLIIVVFVTSLAASAVSAQDDGSQNQLQDRVLNELLTVIEEATGLTRQEFVQALRDGATPAEVIIANGSDVAMVTTNTVAVITERLEEAVAGGQLTSERAEDVLENLERNITAALNGELNKVLRERLQERGGNRIPREVIEVIIAETGLTSFELRDELQNSTIAEVLVANGANVQNVIDRAVGMISERLAKAVESERITQAQADERLQQFEERITDWLAGEGNVGAIRLTV